MEENELPKKKTLIYFYLKYFNENDQINKIIFKDKFSNVLGEY